MDDRFYVSIKACRVNSGMNVEDFAKAIGVSTATIYNWESNSTKPSTEQLVKIAELGHLPIDFLINGLLKLKA